MSLRLMVVTDPVLLEGRDAVAVCQRAVQGGATIVQVRAKGVAASLVAEFTRSLVGALPVPVIVNDRVDVALAAGAAGAHLGQDDVPLDRLRPPLPAGFLLGISVGSPAEADRVRGWPADYWSVGPCFVTGTKRDAGAALGTAGFAALARGAPPGVPVIGIGGVTAAGARELVRAGAAGVAVIAAVLGAPDPERAAREIRHAMDGATTAHG